MLVLEQMVPADYGCDTIPLDILVIHSLGVVGRKIICSPFALS